MDPTAIMIGNTFEEAKKIGKTVSDARRIGKYIRQTIRRIGKQKN
jgi:hypothetical protein